VHSFYVENVPEGSGGRILLPRPESVHAARVLRLRPGDGVRLLDGEKLYRAVLTKVSEEACEATIQETLPSPEAGVRITLWQGLPKGDKLERIVQKATELGVWDIWPVEMERSIGAKGEFKKGERLRRIALEATKQCGRAHVPQVWEPCGFEEALTRISAGPEVYDLVIVAWEESDGLRLSEGVRRAFPWGTAPAGGCIPAAPAALQEGSPSGQEQGSFPRILLVIGPEGGISRAECRDLQARGGVLTTLGMRTLRTETAGPCALAVILTVLGEM